LSYGDSGYWNAAKRWRTPNGGKLMAFTVLGNVQMWYYRTDALQEAGVTPPRTVAEVLAACAKLNKPGATYGAVMRGERGNPIRYDWMHWMLGSGGSVVKDPENGDYTVTLNSPINKTTLDQFIDVAKKCGPPNPGAVSQGEAIQLLATGKALQGQLVLAAWAGLQDPKKSSVAGKLDVLPVPRMANGQHGAVIGNRHYAVPKGAKNKAAALAFGRWFLSQPAQYAYGKAGGIPVRSDVLSSDLAKDPMNRWMTPYLEVLKTAKQELGYQEAAQVEAVLGLKLNQAMIGELSSGKALNQAAQEIKVIFEKNGRKTGVGAALPE
jgi:multiple sugar transport system substrate-binding protein